MERSGRSASIVSCGSVPASWATMPFDVAAAASGPDRAALWRDRTQSGPAWCRAHSEIIDRWLAHLFEEAVAGDDGFALVAVGGYGRTELAPFSDIDVWLLHNGSNAAP